MTDAVISLGKLLLSGCWRLFGIMIPGFTFTFGQALIGVALCGVSIIILRVLLHIGGTGGTSYRSGHSRKVKISKERRDDEF